MWKSNFRSHGRDSCHLKGLMEAGVECVVVRIEVVVVNSASGSRDLEEGLEVELE